MTRSLSVVVVCGLNRAANHALARAWRDTRPASERWALIDNAELSATGFPGGEDPREEKPLARWTGGVWRVAGGCACCGALAGLRASLPRMLRERDPDGLIIELASHGHPGSLIDQLGLLIAPRALSLREVLLAIDPRDAGRYLAAGIEHSVAASQIEAASRVVVVDPSAPSSVSPAAVTIPPATVPSALRERLSRWPPFGRPVVSFGAPDSLSDERTSAADPRSMAGASPGELLRSWRWPAPRPRPTLHRAEVWLAGLIDAASAALPPDGLADVQAVLATGAEVYHWALSSEDLGAPDRAGRLALRRRPTAYRFDDRLELGLAPAAAPRADAMAAAVARCLGTI